MRIRLRRLSHARDLPLPRRASTGSAGYDLHAAVENGVTFAPGERRLVPTGFCLEIPPGFEAQIRPRSGLALSHGLTVLNAPGTVDSDYRGEVGVLLVHLGDEPLTLRRGDRIAQLVLARVEEIAWDEVDELAPSDRGAGGFGSSGTSSGTSS